MPNNVFANGRELNCKKGSGKSICAFPDVCWTPPDKVPPTPTGVPVPYPNTGMASDCSKGSKKVKISGKEVLLKNSSHFKKSMGDEAGVAQLKGMMTMKNRGKIYFQMWSMDVKIEGKNAVRHLDIGTHNHGSQIGNSPPWPFLDEMFLAAIEAWSEAHDKCECCGGLPHSAGKKVDMKTWYSTDNAGNYSVHKEEKYNAVMEMANNRKELGCTCPPDNKVVPEPPCDQFYNGTTKGERARINERYDLAKEDEEFNNAIGRTKGNQGNHLVPKSAGGCPASPGNVQAHELLCDVCKEIDGMFNPLQTNCAK